MIVFWVRTESDEHALISAGSRPGQPGVLDDLCKLLARELADARASG
ncbi:MAG: hypothetical protein ACRDXC_09680 [Acidimicrobiales bacterium]